MFRKYNYRSLFGRRGKRGYKKSRFADIARFNLLFNKGTSDVAADATEDAYKGFISDYYSQLADDAADLYPQQAERAVLDAVHERAISEFAQDARSAIADTGSIFNRIYSRYEVSNLFDDASESDQFSKEALFDFMSYMSGDRNQRQASGNSLFQYADSVMSDLIDRELQQGVKASEQIRQDLESFKASVPSEIDTFTKGGHIRSQKLLDGVDYLNRPGIFPLVAIAADARNELSIDAFQLQNKSMQDYYTTRILQEITNPNRDAPFVVRVNMAFPTGEMPEDMTTYNILGPNLAFYRKLERLQQFGGDKVNIQVQFADRKNHPKVFMNDDTGMIGSMNATRPVGQSIFQAGGNYETMRVLHYRNDAYSPDQLDAEIQAGRFQAQSLDSGSKLYMQLRKTVGRVFSGEKVISTGMRNVAAPYEIFQHLKATVETASRNKNTEMAMMLDQVFFLQYEKDMMTGQRQGEMGPFSEAYLSKNRSSHDRLQQEYQQVQRKFLDLLFEGRAFVVADARNYREKILDPVFERLRSSGLLTSRDSYDPVNLVNRLAVGNSTQARLHTLTEAISKFGFGEDMAVQLMMISSGKVETTALTRQHVKAYALRDVKTGEFLSTNVTGSSNKGFYSTSPTGEAGEVDRVNAEFDLVFANEQVRRHMATGKSKVTFGYSLSNNEELEQMQMEGRNFHQMLRDQGRRHFGQLSYSNVRADWHSSVQTEKLLELEGQIRRLNEMVGADIWKVNRSDYVNGRPVELSVSLDSSRVLGGGSSMSFRLSYTNGFVYMVNENKLVGESEIANMGKSSLHTGLMGSDAKPLIVAPGRRAVIDPIQSTLAMLGSLGVEMSNTALIKSPFQEFHDRFAGNRTMMESAVVNYLARLTGSAGLSASDLIKPGVVSSDRLADSAVKNLHLRLNNDDPLLNKVRDLAGINNLTPEQLAQRQATLTDLTRAIGVFGMNDAKGRAAMLKGGGGAGTDLVQRFENILHNPMYADLLYDVIGAQRDSTYGYGINERFKELKENFTKPYLTRSQAATYGYTQALRKRNMYGVSENRARFAELVSQASVSSETGIRRLASVALFNSPLPFGATSNLGQGAPVYIPVAEGGGSREDGATFPYEMFSNMLSFHEHSKIGDVTGLEIIQDGGVGAIVRRSDVDEYVNQIALQFGHEFASQVEKNLAAELDARQGTAFVFNFDRMKKASQIPQRIKNVIGSRPMSDLTLEYQQMLDQVGAIDYQGKFGVSGRAATSVDLQGLYLQDLRTGLKNIGVSEDRIGTLNEELGLGALYGNKIRRFLSTEVAQELERVRLELMEQYGLSFSQTQTGVGAEILRASLMRRDISDPSALKGFTGSSERFGSPAVMLMQLTGNYSDYMYANAAFGGEGGVRQGFIDKAVKDFQTKKLMAEISLDDLTGALDVDSWTFEKNLHARAGEIISFDARDGKSWVMRYDEQTGDYVKNRAIDSRKEFSVAGNLIESMNRVVSAAYITATSNAANLVAEDARETLREVRILNPNLSKNSVQIELVYDRTMKGGGGRRLEAYGGLFKAVPLMVQKEGIQKLLNNIGRNDINIYDVIGAANPSNFKSYMYHHGATLLTHRPDGRNRLIDQTLAKTNSSVLAASLLLGTGLSAEELTKGEDGRYLNQDAEAVIRALGRSAGSSGLGSYFKNMYAASALLNQTTDELKLGEMFIEEISKERMGAALQTPSLRAISLRDIANALNGVDGSDSIMKGKLQNFFQTGDMTYEYLTNNIRNREMIILAGALDMYSQLASQNMTEMKTVDVTRDRQAYLTLGTMAGLTYDQLMEGQDTLAPLLQNMASTTPMLVTYVPVAGSQSKVPVSSRDKGRIELQHIIADPFTPQIKAFQETGSTGGLRRLVASLVGSMSNMTPDRILAETGDLKNLGIQDMLDPYYRSNLFKSKAMAYYANNLDSGTFAAMRQKYQLFSTLQVMANTMTTIGDSETAMMQTILEKGGLRGGVRDTIDQAIQNKDLRSLQVRVEMGLESSLREFEAVNAQYRLNPDKAFGIEYGEAFVRTLKGTGMRTMAFSMPSLEISGGQVRFNKARKQFSFLLDGEFMSIMGQQFGGFESEHLKAMQTLVGGFAEGTNVSKFFDHIASLQDVSGVVDIDLETAQELMEFQNTALKFPELLADSLGGDRVAQIFGHGVGLDGGTFTAAAMFGIPDRAAVLSEAIIAKHGGHAPLGRVSALQTLERKLAGTYKRLTQLQQSLDQVGDISDLYKRQNAGEELDENALGLVRKRDALIAQRRLTQSTRKLLTYQVKALEEGISPGAKLGLGDLVSESQLYRQKIESAQGDSQLLAIFDGLSGRLDKYKNTRTSAAEAGDYFVKLASMSEMQILQAEALGRLSTRSDRPQDYTTILKRARALKRTANFIQGDFLFGSESKLSVESRLDVSAFEGEIRKHGSDLNMKQAYEKTLRTAQDIQGAIAEIRRLAEDQKNSFIADLGDVSVFGNMSLSDTFAKLNRRLDKLEVQLKEQGNNSAAVEDVRLFLESDTKRFFTEFALARASIQRPAPPGSEFSSFSSKKLLMTTGDLNRYMEEKGYSFRLDTERNRTLGMVNPVSFSVSQLGDFDGDTYVAILDYTAKMEVDVTRRHRVLANKEQELQALQSKLAGALPGSLDYAQLSQQVERSRESMRAVEADISELEQTIKRSKETYQRTGFEDAARKWVANYLKVDERIFTSKTNGGFGDRDVDVNVLFTYVEQARGLFGGMEDVMHKWNPVYSTLLEVAKNKTELNTQDRFHALLAQSSEDPFLKFLHDNQNLSEDVRHALLRAHEDSDGLVGGVASYVGKMATAQAGNGELQKYLGRQFGTVMSGDNFDMMLKTLGEAGSVILGKTYNTMIGLLFSESPMLATAYAMESNGQLRDAFVQDHGEDAYHDLMKDLREAKSYSENMGGFLQSVNQLMRDSIKPKQSEKFFRDIEAELENYHAAESDADRDKVVERIVKHFGPGSGLKGLIQMDRLVKNMSTLNREYRDEGQRSEQAAFLESKFGIGHELEEEISARLGFEKKDGYRQYGESTELSKGTSRTALVAAYKTKQDLLNLTAGFAFEKAIADSKLQSAKSTGRGLLDLFQRSMEAEGAVETRQQYQNYVDSANQFYSGEAKKTDFNREQQEYIDSVRTLYEAGQDYLSVGSTEKLFHAMTFVKTRSQMEPFAGRFGEKLIGMARYEESRTQAYAGNAGISADDWHFTQGGVVMANVQAFASGKVGPEHITGMFDSLVEAYRRQTGKNSADMGDVVQAIAGWGSLSETESSKRGMAKVTSWLSQKKDTAVETMFLSSIRNTALGQMSSSLMQFVNHSLKGELEVKDVHEEWVKQLTRYGVSEESAKHFITQAQMQSARSVGSSDSTGLEHFLRGAIVDSKRGYSKPTMPEATRAEKFVTSRLTKGADLGFDSIIIPMLGLIGQSIASGNVSPEALQQTVGNSLMAMSYMRAGMLDGKVATKPLQAVANTGIGMGFKMRFAMEEQDGDAGKALMATALREASIAAVTATLTEPVAHVASRMMGKTVSLDLDRYENLRGITSNVVGAVATTILGMLVGETVQKAVMGGPEPSLVESAIKAAQNAALEMQRMMGMAEEVDEGYEVTDTQAGLVEYITYQSFAGDPDTNSATNAALYGTQDLEDEPSNTVGGDWVDGYSFDLGDG